MILRRTATARGFAYPGPLLLRMSLGALTFSHARPLRSTRLRNRLTVIERLHLVMFWIRVLPEFTDWIEGLKDATVRGVIVARINESNAV